MVRLLLTQHDKCWVYFAPIIFKIGALFLAWMQRSAIRVLRWHFYSHTPGLRCAVSRLITNLDQTICLARCAVHPHHLALEMKIIEPLLKTLFLLTNDLPLGRHLSLALFLACRI